MIPLPPLIRAHWTPPFHSPPSLPLPPPLLLRPSPPTALPLVFLFPLHYTRKLRELENALVDCRIRLPRRGGDR